MDALPYGAGFGPGLYRYPALLHLESPIRIIVTHEKLLRDSSWLP